MFQGDPDRGSGAKYGFFGSWLFGLKFSYKFCIELFLALIEFGSFELKFGPHCVYSVLVHYTRIHTGAQQIRYSYLRFTNVLVCTVNLCTVYDSMIFR